MSDPVHGRLVSAVAIEGGSVALTINRGLWHGIQSGVRGELWSGGAPIADSGFSLMAVKDRESNAIVKLPIEVVATCDDVQITSR